MIQELVSEIVLVLIGRLMLRPCNAGPYLKSLNKYSIIIKCKPIETIKHKIVIAVEDGSVRISVTTKTLVENQKEPIKAVVSRDKYLILFEDDFLLNLRELFSENMVGQIIELIEKNSEQ